MNVVFGKVPESVPAADGAMGSYVVLSLVSLRARLEPQSVLHEIVGLL